MADKKPTAKSVESLWNGGERRRAAEVLRDLKLKETERDALMAKLPGIRDLYNRIQGAR